MDEKQKERFVALRRELIGREFDSLNEMQRQAVLTTEGPLLLLAGAGSGKTTVLIHRIANLIRFGRASDTREIPAGFGEAELEALERAAAGSGPMDPETAALCALGPVEPWRIIAITFTNKAANQLKDRLAGMLGPAAQEIWAMTFHAACCRILRREIDRLGYDKQFTIYDTADSERVMKDVMKDRNVDERELPARLILKQISRAKDVMQFPEDYARRAQRAGDERLAVIAACYAEYQRRLQEANALDFDDIILLTVKLLQDFEEVRTAWQQRFRYVLIDEYQDTNHLQYLFASLMAGGYRNICVVGDDDQSIYKFRGATIENILSFEEQYKDARVIRLEQNYRSTGNILRAANAVIANNTQRKGKKLWTQKGNGEKITLYVARNEDDEADFVSRIIKTSNRPARDFAVLYRTNAQSRSLETAFRRFGLNYKVFGGTRFFDRAEVKDILAYLSVVANPTDETRLLRIVNEPPRKIGQASLDKALEAAREEGISLFQVMSSASHRAGIAAGKRMEEFCRMIGGLQALVSQVPLDEFYDELLQRTGYLAALEAKGGDENLARIENIRELKTSIVKNVEATGGDLYSFLDEVALYTDMDSYDRNADAAVLMTMHSAKGLEFPIVFIVGAEEGLFPGSMAIGDPEEMEEERRLCYVAVTRAREKLYITCAAQRMLYGRTNANLPSRFTEEIPDELIERRGVGRKREEQRSYWDDDGGFRYLGDFASYRGRQEPPHRTPKSAFKPHGVTRSPQKPAPAPSAGITEPLKAGDRILHKAFGKGVILKATPMGGDALLEVRFDSGETKKLMQRIAMQQMQKAD